MTGRKYSVVTRLRRGLGGLLHVAALGTVALALQACTVGGPLQGWKMVEAQEPELVPAVEGTAPQPVAVVFYRELGAGESAGNPINIYINGQYQASLVSNTYTEQALCPGEQQFMVAFNDVRQRYVSKEEGWVFDIEARPIQYFRVSGNDDGGAVIAQVDSATAEAARANLQKRQAHTISRVVNKGCAAR